MRAAWTIALANLRRLLGDRRIPLFFVGLPILIMVLVGTTFGTGGKRLTVGVVADKHDSLARDFVDAMQQSSLVRPRHVGGAKAVRSAVRRGRVTAGVVLPPNYGQTIRGGGAAVVSFIVQPVRAESIEARFYIAALVSRTNADITIARATAARTGESLDAALAAARRATAAAPGLTRHDKRPASPFSYTAPANLVLFAFITGLVTSSSVLASRQLGVTSRVLTTPTSAAAAVAGDMAGIVLLALMQASLMLFVGKVFFGVAFGATVAVVLLLLAIACAAAGAGLLLTTFARSSDQVIATAPAIGIGLGMLGGCMWSLESVGPLMRKVGHLVPQAWAMDAFVRLIFDHRGLAGIYPQLAVLAAFAVGLLALAATRLRRSVVA